MENRNQNQKQNQKQNQQNQQEPFRRNPAPGNASNGLAVQQNAAEPIRVRRQCNSAYSLIVPSAWNTGSFSR